MTQRRAAKRIEPRTVTVRLAGDYEGWEATVRADFKSRYWADLYSGDPDRFLPVLTKITIEHNFPDAETDELAESIGDVDMPALTAFLTALNEEIGKLPPR